MRKKMMGMLAICALTLLACNKDDSTPEVRNVTDVNGNYQGKMITTQIPVRSTNIPGTDVLAQVKSDTVYFNDFPVRDLITSLVGSQAAEGIIAALGQVNYKVGYTAALSTARDSIYLTLAPQPLTLEFSLPGETTKNSVKVTVTAPKKAAYAYASKNLYFDLNAEEVELNGTPLGALFTPTRFTFLLTKK